MANEWQGERIRLRSTEPEDWTFFFDLDHDSEMARALDIVWFPRSAEASREWAKKEAQKTPDDDHISLVIETNKGETVGGISSHSIDRRVGTFGYGIAIAPAFRGQGYASEAIVLFLKHFFLERRYQKVTTPVFSFNTASIKMHEKLGFKQEARLRRMGFTRGEYFDFLMYGMIIEEFTEKYLSS
ncbi:MAG: GNAT family N-acetyltransferase [Anaerolineae bacterium]|nr:GNAT family N-acetyltransferase [Anaerolineae bacterium]